jgi:hypothetical protein
MNLIPFVSAIAVILVVLIITYQLKFKAQPWDSYIPKIAWTRGGIYFCCCYLLSYFSGAMELLVSTPLFTQEQLDNPNWLIYTACSVTFIVIAYSIVWSYYTPVFKRDRNILISALFGFLWGSSSGQLFLSIWLISNMIDWPIWAAWIATWAVLGAYQPNWHNIYWDHYIAPEHDTPMTQKIKALGCHIPNLTINLVYLALFDNYLIFVLLQVAACTSAGIGMRYPAPWAAPSKLNLAARTNATPPRCTGYLVKDYTSDPYCYFHPGWKKPDST